MKKLIIILVFTGIISGIIFISTNKAIELPRFIENTLHILIPSSDQDILFEFRLPKTTHYNSEVYFECITDDVVAPAFMEKAQIRTIDNYLVFSGEKTDTCIITPDDTKIAGIISQK